MGREGMGRKERNGRGGRKRKRGKPPFPNSHFWLCHWFQHSSHCTMLFATIRNIFLSGDGAMAPCSCALDI